MNCFECGSKTLTSYYCFPKWIKTPIDGDKITAVRKDCMNCKWHSFPTQIPKKIEPFDNIKSI